MNDIMIVSNDNMSSTLIREIIEDNDLGSIILKLKNDDSISDEILFYNPDILIIDYKLGDLKGLDIVKYIKSNDYRGKIIMITNTSSDYIITTAYKSGVSFLVTKPINYFEIYTLLTHLKRFINIEIAVKDIDRSLKTINKSLNQPTRTKKISGHSKMTSILTDIGIIGELGTDDLILLIENIIDFKRDKGNSQYLLQDMYIDISIKQSEKNHINISPNTIEQRIRRTIQKGLSNIAEMGLDDYYNTVFSDYSTALFDFQQVRQEMNFLKGKSHIEGRVNIRKFVEGMISKIEI